MKRGLIGMFVLALGSLYSVQAAAHCQVPCGIYGDHQRVHALNEDAATITKAVVKITELAEKSDVLSKNQLARWVSTKESHASHIITVIAEYFLTQKIKPPAKKNKRAWTAYVARLVVCHKVMRAAMKTKQTVSLHAVEELKVTLSSLSDLYPPSK